MAVGYSRTATVQVLLDYGADPEVADKEGRTVVDLVEKLRAAMPLTPELLGRRTMLEDVAGVLTGTLGATDTAAACRLHSALFTICLGLVTCRLSPPLFLPSDQLPVA